MAASWAARPRAPRGFRSTASFPLEARLALLHERAPALLVVLALRAALDRRAHAPGVRRTGGFHVFLEDGLGIGDRQRRAFTQASKKFSDRGSQPAVCEQLMHQS